MTNTMYDQVLTLDCGAHGFVCDMHVYGDDNELAPWIAIFGMLNGGVPAAAAVLLLLAKTARRNSMSRGHARVTKSPCSRD